MQTILSKLINTLKEKQINNKDLRKLINDINSETNIEKQLKIVLKNKQQIKDILLNQ